MLRAPAAGDTTGARVAGTDGLVAGTAVGAGTRIGVRQRRAGRSRQRRRPRTTFLAAET